MKPSTNDRRHYLESLSRKKEALLKSLQTSPEKGLTSGQAAQRLSQYGENKLHEKKKKTNLQRFFEQFKDVMIMILLPGRRRFLRHRLCGRRAYGIL